MNPYSKYERNMITRFADILPINLIILFISLRQVSGEILWMCVFVVLYIHNAKCCVRCGGYLLRSPFAHTYIYRVVLFRWWIVCCFKGDESRVQEHACVESLWQVLNLQKNKETRDYIWNSSSKKPSHSTTTTENVSRSAWKWQLTLKPGFSLREKNAIIYRR